MKCPLRQLHWYKIFCFSIPPPPGWIVEWSIQTARRDESVIPYRSIQTAEGVQQHEDEQSQGNMTQPPPSQPQPLIEVQSEGHNEKEGNGPEEEGKETSNNEGGDGQVQEENGQGKIIYLKELCPAK